MEALYQLSYSPVMRGRMLAGRSRPADTPERAGGAPVAEVSGRGPAAAARQLLDGGAVRMRRISGGHIHTTWRLVDATGRLWCLQRLGTTVFPDPPALLRNVERVLARVAGDSSGAGTRRPRLVERADGWWRLTPWIRGRRPRVGSRRELVAAVRGIARFDVAVGPLADELETLIAGFHDLAGHRRRLEEVRRADPLGRSGPSDAHLDRVLDTARRVHTEVVDRGWENLPVRVSHGDAKVANVVLAPDGSVHMIDLDTVMPGSVVHDLGEFVRSIGDVHEDGRRRVDTAVLAEVVACFATAFGRDVPLDDAERSCLAWAGAVMAAENAVRFAADHLVGDVWFHAPTPGANLRRALNQAALADALGAVAPVVAREAGL